MKSNEALLTIRQNLITVFKKYEYIIVPVLKFVLCFSALRMLIETTSYEGTLKNIVIQLVIAAVGAFASAGVISICTILLATLLVMANNMILGVMLFLFLCLVYILYGHLFPKESLMIIVMLVALGIRLELLVPIITALFGSYISVGALLIGIMIWYYMPSLMQVLPAGPIDKNQILDTVNQLINLDYKALLLNKEMLVMMVIVFIVFSGVYFIRKQPIDYGPYIAIGVGSVLNVLGFGLGKIFFPNLHIDLIMVVLMTVLAAVVACCMQFLSIALDYQRAEVVNFEDDDNYYYVKIVPKIYIGPKKKVVKHVYSKKTQENRSHTLTKEEQLHQMIMEDEEYL